MLPDVIPALSRQADRYAENRRHAGRKHRTQHTGVQDAHHVPIHHNIRKRARQHRRHRAPGRIVVARERR